MTTKVKIDDVLASGKRSLRTLPKACLLGPTGARLWADYVDPVPGFAGAIDFIHKLNIPLLYTVKPEGCRSFEPANVSWFPSHLKTEFKGLGFRYTEKKFISWDDCAVSCQVWENIGERDLVLKLDTDSARLQVREGGGFSGVLDVPQYEFRIRAVIETSRPELVSGLVLPPNGRVELIVAAALGIEGADWEDELRRRAERFTANESGMDEIITKQQSDYQSWFDRTPRFESSDPLLDKTWQYRWFVLRHNLADPRWGRLQHPLFYEGRSHKMSKTPFEPKGWEFSKMIPLTVPMHLLEARWYPDTALGKGVMSNMKASQDEEGFYRCLFVNQTLHSYANFMGWAAYQYYLVHRDIAFIREILPSLKAQVNGEGQKLGNRSDKLLTEYTHNRTGKEYQPSYWYFHQFPKDIKDPNTFTPLKRVDRSVYHYLNSTGVARLCEALGDDEAPQYRELAGEIRRDILNKMWDANSTFFYDLHYENDDKAFVKNVVGFYPYWAQITESEHDEGLLHAFVDSEFNTPCAFPSVSADCPVYQPEGGWQGHFFKGRNGCVWDGPTWPYTNSIVLDALAAESKRRQHTLDERFGYYLREYAMLHFSNRDLKRPYLVEHYSSQTGEALSDEVDYNHSYYIDLLIRHVAGLTIEEKRIVLDPVNISLDYFHLSGIHAAGHQIDVSYSKHGGSLPQGYTLTVDGQIVCSSERLARMEYNL
ncbi:MULTISPECIES: MGH1-like glycoside hydrolase domain-containing protein [unclassified Paenibacillus]|uniref:MGH1-like glycoside hydrolase domain-containing protein n=1 Tax=unclassified Paenibacillus TaxID=185978 RepID=UPI0036455095